MHLEDSDAIDEPYSKERMNRIASELIETTTTHDAFLQQMHKREALTMIIKERPWGDFGNFVDKIGPKGCFVPAFLGSISRYDPSFTFDFDSTREAIDELLQRFLSPDEMQRLMQLQMDKKDFDRVRREEEMRAFLKLRFDQQPHPSGYTVGSPTLQKDYSAGREAAKQFVFDRVKILMTEKGMRFYEDLWQ